MNQRHGNAGHSADDGCRETVQDVELGVQPSTTETEVRQLWDKDVDDESDDHDQRAEWKVLLLIRVAGELDGGR